MALAGDFAGALETAKEIEDRDDRARALRAIATAQAEKGDPAAALEAVQRIEDAYNRAQTLREIAVASTEAGK